MDVLPYSIVASPLLDISRSGVSFPCYFLLFYSFELNKFNIVGIALITKTIPDKMRILYFNSFINISFGDSSLSFFSKNILKKVEKIEKL